MSIIISPSILSADFANLEQDIAKVTNAGAQWIHIDVMDGHFVPNITIGAPVVKSIRKITNSILDVHLMIENPERYIEDFINAGADIITVHIEACNDNILDIIKTVKASNKKIGLSIKPNTPVSSIKKYLNQIDLVLVMSVEPGFGGQSFMENSLEKISELNIIKNDNNLNIYIEVDGGINDKTSKLSINAGANALVAGSFIYNAKNVKESINQLKTN